MITVYSTPGCVQCDVTYRALENAHIPFEVVDVTDNPAAAAYVRGLGYLRAPVVVVEETQHWSGFRPDLIAALSTRIEKPPTGDRS